MISQSFIDRGLFIVRVVCDRCDGEGQLEHPLMEAYRKSPFNCWEDFFTSCGIDTSQLPTRQEIDCPQCKGLGYEERELSIAHVVEHCIITDHALENKIRQVIRNIERENQTLSDVFGPDPDELEQTIRQVIRKVQQEEQGLKDLAEFIEPDDL